MLALIKKGLFYTFSVGTESLIAVALLPILTSTLSPHDYGIWVILFSFAVFLRPALNLMFQDILRMKYFNSTPKEILGLIRISIILPSILGLILSVFSLIFSEQIEKILHFPSADIWKVALFSALHGFYYVILALLQFKEKPALFLTQQIIQCVITICATLIFLKLEIGWLSPLYARSLALLINSSLGFKWICQTFGNPLKTKIEGSYLKNYVSIGLQFLPVGLAPVIIPFVNRLIVSHLLGVEETSYFGIGALFSSGIIIVSTGFIYAWQPILYRELNSQKIDASIKYYSLTYFLLLPLAGFLLAILGIFIAPYIMKYDLALVRPYIIWLSVATVSECFYQHNYVYLKGLQRAKLLSYLACFLIILNTLMVYYFVENLGGLGAAWGTACTYLMLTVISGFFIIAIATKKA
jgi:O-antigen/teichoic acid export membrane protein